jgi:DNA-directed RNA polymerase
LVPPRIKATTLESQLIHLIQELSGRTLKDRQKRNLLKTPGMAMGYGITDFGMAEAICDEYRELFELNEPTDKAAFFLAQRIRRACRELLPRNDELMAYVREIAERCASLGIVMEWVNPTGIRFSSLYETPNIDRVYLLSGVEHRIVSGPGKPDPDKAASAATANLIHSLDSAHMVRVINAMAARGMGLLPVHDCYAFLASNAVLVNQIIRQQWCWMYEAYDVLGLLHRWNADGANSISPPPLGNLNLRDSVGWSPYCVM